MRGTGAYMACGREEVLRTRTKESEEEKDKVYVLLEDEESQPYQGSERETARATDLRETLAKIRQREMTRTQM